jgi:hypothetical protein
MSDNEPNLNVLMFEILRKIQTDLADLKRDNSDLKSSSAMILGMIGELVKAAGRDEARFAGLEVRIERIERRLNLTDA